MVDLYLLDYLMNRIPTLLSLGYIYMVWIKSYLNAIDIQMSFLKSGVLSSCDCDEKKFKSELDELQLLCSLLFGITLKDVGRNKRVILLTSWFGDSIHSYFMNSEREPHDNFFKVAHLILFIWLESIENFSKTTEDFEYDVNIDRRIEYLLEWLPNSHRATLNNEVFGFYKNADVNFSKEHDESILVIYLKGKAWTCVTLFDNTLSKPIKCFYNKTDEHKSFVSLFERYLTLNINDEQYKELFLGYHYEVGKPKKKTRPNSAKKKHFAKEKHSVKENIKMVEDLGIGLKNLRSRNDNFIENELDISIGSKRLITRSASKTNLL